MTSAWWKYTRTAAGLVLGGTLTLTVASVAIAQDTKPGAGESTEKSATETVTDRKIDVEPKGAGDKAAEEVKAEEVKTEEKPEPVVVKEEPKPEEPKVEEKVVETPAPIKVKTSGDVMIPEAPKSGLEADIYAIMDKHCARCHQEGKLGTRLKVAKNFGGVLDLKALARDPSVILPGNPDGSKIYKQLVNQEMPYDVYYEYTGGEEPTADEIDKVRTWIESLGAKDAASCKERPFVSNVDIVKAISHDLNKLQDHRVRGTRYITLSHLYNACATDHEMEVYRQGVVKLLNSLSYNSDVLRLHTIDEYQTIIRFHLDDLKWSEQDWEYVLSVYPYAVKPDTKLFDFVTSATYTALPFVRGDWFGYTASRPPLYNYLLKLPDSLQELEHLLGLDIKHNIKTYLAQRAGFQKSGVSRNNRLIERHTIKTGMFWTSYDFAGNKGRQSLFLFPLGPGGKYAFKEDGGESIWSLPNHFQAYYLSTETGKILNKGPVEIVIDHSRRDLSVTNGISCFGCHDQGIRKAKDEIREHILNDRSFPKHVREAVEALYPPNEVMDKLIEEDTKRFTDAMRKAGLDPTLKLNGVEMINALSDRFERDVELKLAAAEHGLTEEDYLVALGQAGGPAFALKRRLEQGIVPRDQFEGLFAHILPLVSDDHIIETKGFIKKVKEVKIAKTVHKPTYKVARPAPRKKEYARDFHVALFSDKSTYYVGDLPVFRIKTAENCHLTLINVDGKGVGTVIYPNKFEQKNFLKAGHEFVFPAHDAPYQFRLRDPGHETVIAVCSTGKGKVDHIVHDFKKHAFTGLGEYRKHLTRAIVVESRKPPKAKIKKAKRVKGKKKLVHHDILARTAIKIKVLK